MPPKIKCPNCQQNEWLENSHLNHLPNAVRLDDGKYAVDVENGVSIKTWRCNNCMYVMQFWEPG
ncbi:MAG: hypothetical protein EB829_02120 [Nitrosopumilus sp. H8]|nr:MAG: hypothetical protein EB829_02120 [Nitrosopumilus sp. H8]